MGGRLKALVAALIVGQLALVSVGGQATAAQPLAGATISGTVETEAGYPVDGAAVYLVDDANSQMVDDGGFVAVDLTEDGEYRFEELPFGSYQAYVVPPLNQNRFWHDAGYVDPAVIPVTWIDVAPAQPSADVSFGLPMGGFGGNISGNDGSVDEFGAPVRIPLTQATATFLNVDTGFSETVTILPNGNFGLGYIPAGVYELTVDGNGRSYVHPDLLDTGVTGGSIAISVPLGANSISGEVRTSTGDTVFGARITAVDVTSGQTVATVLTDGSGDPYVLANLPDGDYHVSAVAPGNSSELWFDRGFGDRIGLPASTITVGGPAPAATGINFEFPDGGFGGFINGESGTDVDGDGQDDRRSLGDAVATFTHVDTGYTEKSTIDGRGNFGLGYIPIGEYTLSVEYGTSGRRSYTFPTSYDTGEFGLSMSVTVPRAPGIVSGAVDSGGYPAEGATVTIVDPSTGDDIARVVTAGDDQDGADPDDGTYIIDNLDLGTYWAYATAPGNQTRYWYGSGYADPDDVTPTLIELTTVGPEATIDFSGSDSFPTGGFGGSIRRYRAGPVPDGEDPTEPLPLDATVTFTHLATGVTETMPIQPGGTTGVGYVPTGEYTIAVDFDGRRHAFPQTYETGPNGLSFALIVPRLPGAIEGRVTSGVTDGGGAPEPSGVVGAEIGLVPVGGIFPIATAATDDTGAYRIDDLAPGDYELYTIAPLHNLNVYWYGFGFGDRATATPTVITLDGVDDEVDIDLDLPPGRFDGSLQGPGEPGTPPNAQLSFRNVETGFIELAGVDDNGTFDIGHLPIGTYEIAAWWDQNRTYTFPEVFETGPTGLSIALSIPSQVSGMVVSGVSGLDGLPRALDGATVGLVDAVSGVDVVSTTTRDDGRFWFDYLAPGTYYVYAQAPGNQSKLWLGGDFSPLGVGDPPTELAVAGYTEINDPVVFDFPTAGFGGAIFGDDGSPDSVVLDNASVRVTAVVDGLPDPDTFTDVVLADPGGTWGIGYLPSGDYQFTVSYTIGEGILRSFTLDQVETVGADGLSIVLRVPYPPIQPATLRGTVFDADGNVAGGARVRLFDGNDSEVADTTTEPDGTYVLTAEPGIYRLIASQNDQAAEVDAIALAEGVDVTQNVTMAGPFVAELISVSGEVVDADGGVFDSGQVFASCDVGLFVSSRITGGVFEFEIPASGCFLGGSVYIESYEQLPDGTDRSSSSSFSFAAGFVSTSSGFVTIQLPTTTLDVVVVDGSGEPVPVSRIDIDSWSGGDEPPGVSIDYFNSNRYGLPLGPSMFLVGRSSQTNISVQLADGRNLSRTVDTTNGPITAEFVVDELELISVSGEVVDADGGVFDSGQVFASCDVGLFVSSRITGGVFEFEIPASGCFLGGSVYIESYEQLPDGTDRSSSSSFSFAAGFVSTSSGFVTIQLPTTTLDVVVVDGSGEPVPVSRIDIDSWSGGEEAPGVSIDYFYSNRYGLPLGPSMFLVGRSSQTNISVQLADGRNLSRTVDTTNGPITAEFVVDELELISVSGEVVDADGGVFDSGQVFASCDVGLFVSSRITGGVFEFEIPASGCFLGGSVYIESYEQLPDGTDRSSSSSFSFAAGFVSTSSGFVTIQLPTTTLDVVVVDGSGEPVPVSRIDIDSWSGGEEAPGVSIDYFYSNRYGLPLGPSMFLVGRSSQTNISVQLADGRNLSRTVDTTNGPITAELLVAGSSPQWIISQGSIPSQVSGTVVSGVSGLDGLPRAVDGATVGLVDVVSGVDVVATTTRDGGRFWFDYLAPGTYFAYAQAPGNQSKLWLGGDFSPLGVGDPPTELVVAGYTEINDPVVFDFPTAGFGGAIFGDDGSADSVVLDNASVRVTAVVDGLPDPDTFTDWVLVDPGGTWGIGYLPSGDYQFTVSYTIGAGIVRSFTLDQVETVGADGLSIVLRVPYPPIQPATLRGTVFDADGNVAGGARVRLFDGNDSEVADTTTEPDGTYVLTAEPGTYRLIASQNDQTGELLAQVLPEGDSFLDVRLRNSIVVVTSEFVDGDGDLFDDIYLYFNCDDGSSGQAQAVDGVISTAVPDTSCTFSGDSYKNGSVEDGYRNESYSFSSTLPDTPGSYTWQIPTVPVTVNVVDGGGNDVPITRARIEANNYDWDPGSGYVEFTGPHGDPFNIEWARSELEYYDNPTAGAVTLNALAVPNVTVQVTLANGLNLTRQIDATNGPTVIELIIGDLEVVTSEFVDGDGDLFDDIYLYFNCDDGSSGQAQAVDGVISTAVPDTSCTFSGDSYKNGSVEDGYRNESYSFSSTLPDTPGSYTWQIPTVPVTVNVVDGGGNDVPITRARIEANNYDWDPGSGYVEFTGPHGDPFNIEWARSELEYYDNPTAGAVTLNALAVPNVTVQVTLANGLNLTRQIDATNGPTVIELIIGDLEVVTSEFVDGDGDLFDDIYLYFNCDDGSSGQAQAVDGVISTAVPDTSCTFSGDSYKNGSVEDGYRNESYSFSSTLPDTPGSYTWQIPTVPVTVNVVDGGGNDVPITRARIEANNYDWDPGSGYVEFTGPHGDPFNIEWASSELEYYDNPTAGAVTLNALAVPNVTVQVTLANGLNLTRQIDATNGPTVIELIASGNLWIVSQGTAEIFDNDGVADSVEAQVPARDVEGNLIDGVSGDGNGDGLPDYEQQNVSSLPSSAGNYLTFVAEPSGEPSEDAAVLENVQTFDPVTGPPTLPDGAEWNPPSPAYVLPDGLSSFQINNVPVGGTRIVKIYVSDASQLEGYAKVDNSGNWYILGSEFVDIDQDLNVITLTLTDGGVGDFDGEANGVIVDPGGPIEALTDVSPPEISIGGVSEGSVYVVGSVPLATCTATDDIDSDASCDLTGYSDQAGVHTVTAAATDASGNSASESVTYTVVEPSDFGEGFGGPIDMDKLNTGKAKRAFPIFFNVFQGGVEITDPALVKLTVSTFPCDVLDQLRLRTDAVEDTGRSELALDYVDDQFKAKLKIGKSGPGCYALSASVIDGSGSVTTYFDLS